MAIYDGVDSPSIYVAFESTAPFTQVPNIDILQIGTSRGRTSPDKPFSVGSLTISLNNESGIYDPNYTGTSPYVSGGVSKIRKGQMMFFLLKIDGFYWPQFFGFLDNVTVNQGVSPYTTFTFTDGTDLLSTSLFPPSFYERDAETTASRVTSAVTYSTPYIYSVSNLVGNITAVSSTGSAVTYTTDRVYVPGLTVSVSGVTPSGYNFTDKVITSVSGNTFTVASTATGTYTSGGTSSIKHVQMQATLGNGSPLATIQEAARCEGVDFYMTFMGIPDPDTDIYETLFPNLMFEPIPAKFNKVTRLQFSDTLDTDFLSYDSIDTDDGAYNYTNRAIYQYPNFNSTANLQVSAQFGDGDIAGPITNAPVANSYAATNLAVYAARKLATPTPSIKSLSFQAIGIQQDIYTDLLQLDLQDQITVSRTTAQTQDYDLVVEGIKHHITPNSWRITLTTSAMNPYYTVIDKSGG